MQSKESRKQLAAQYKEKKPQVGAYAVRCTTTGRVWVGSSRNLAATKNGLWFGLRTGLHRGLSLQDEWNAQGEPAFQYEVLEALNEDVNVMNVWDVLKEKKQAWVAQLGAEPLL
jgi:hypothetical protein